MRSNFTRRSRKNALLESLESRLLFAANSLSIAATDNAAAEEDIGPQDTATLTITRAGDTTNALTVFYKRTGTAKAPADFTANGTATSIVIPAGEDHIDITLTPINDTVAEPDETIIYTLVAKPAYDLDANVNNRTAAATLHDNEPVVSIAATDADAAETALALPADTGTLRIARTGDTTHPLTVAFTRTGTAKIKTDYTATGAATSAVIPAGEDHIDITLSPVDNALAEPNETVIYKLLAKPAYTLDPVLANRTATVTIADDEPIVTVLALDAGAAETQTGEAAATGTFRIQRSGDTSSTLVVKFTLAGTAKRPLDYILSGDGGVSVLKTLTVTIPANQLFTDITLSPVDDVLTDPDETAILTIAKSTLYNLPADPADAAGTVTITDNEPVVSVINTKDASEVSAATKGKGTFTFSRTGLTAAPLTVHYSVTGTATAGDDYAALAGTVIIPAGKSSVTVDVVPITEDDIEGTETVIVTLDTSSDYQPSLAKGAATLNIADSPIAAAGLFGNVTFTETFFQSLAGIQISSGGTFTSTNGRTGSYNYNVINAPGQTKFGTLRLLYDGGDPILDAEALILTFTSARPNSLNGKTIQWPTSAAGSSGSVVSNQLVEFGLLFLDVSGYFKIV